MHTLQVVQVGNMFVVQINGIFDSLVYRDTVKPSELDKAMAEAKIRLAELNK